MFFKLTVAVCLLAAVSCDVSHLHKPHQGEDSPVKILRQEYEINPDGSYNITYETENGISFNEFQSIQIGKDLVTKNVQGSYKYTSPEGQPISIQYVADENGYQPQGDLPTPPPVPAAIQKAIAYNLRHQLQPELVQKF